MYMHGEQHTFILCAFMPIKELNIPDGLFVFMLFNVWLISLMETYHHWLTAKGVANTIGAPHVILKLYKVYPYTIYY